MSLESFTLIDNNNSSIYLGDYGLYIGNTSRGLSLEGFLPNSNDNVVDDIVRMDGSIFQSKNIENREINIPVYFSDKTNSEMDELKGLLYCTSPKKLILDRHEYKYIWVVNNGNVDVNYIWKGNSSFDGFFDISYIAYDPLYYSVFDSESLPSYLEDLEESTSYGQLSYDANLPYLEDLEPFSYTNVTANGSLTLNNRGNYPTKLKIEITGSATNLEFFNLSNDKTFIISSISSEFLRIDGTRGIISNETELKTNLFDGDFITLEKGENIINISSDNINLSSLKFIYKYTYI